MNPVESLMAPVFTCPCGCGFAEADPRLLAALELLRRRLEKRIHIISGCRCPSHNRAVGGSAGSQHLLGAAADIAVAGMPLRQVCQAAMEIPAFRGFGLDEQRNVLHLDVRAQRAHWVYLGGRPVSGWPEGLAIPGGEA